jgi:hypothetical protein
MFFLAASFGAVARAQDGPPSSDETQAALPLSRFTPSWAGDRFFGTASPYAPGHLELHGRVDGEYVHDPFVIRRRVGDDTEDVGSVVSHQLLLHTNATLSVFSRLAINLDMPFALYQAGDDPSEGSVAFASPSGAEAGDLRVGLRANLTGKRDDFFQLGMGAMLWIPTAPSEPGSYLGNGIIRGKPHIMASGVALRFVWGVDAGIEFRETQDVLGVEQGSLLTLSLANGVLLGQNDQVQLSVELSGALVPIDISDRTSNFEALAGAKWRFLDNFVVGGAVGPGLFTGIGTPDVRAVLSVAYTPLPQLSVLDAVRTARLFAR